MEQNVLAISDYYEILLRRKWSLILPAVFVFAAAVAVAFKLTPTYSSTATILVENPAISENYLSDPSAEFAEFRINTIKQKVLHSELLWSIIENHNLFEKLREKETPGKKWRTNSAVR